MTDIKHNHARNSMNELLWSTQANPITYRDYLEATALIASDIGSRFEEVNEALCEGSVEATLRAIDWAEEFLTKVWDGNLEDTWVDQIDTFSADKTHTLLTKGTK
jgi:hypothetical protein